MSIVPDDQFALANRVRRDLEAILPQGMVYAFLITTEGNEPGLIVYGTNASDPLIATQLRGIAGELEQRFAKGLKK